MLANRDDSPTSRQFLLEASWLLTAVTVPLWINLWANQPFDPAKISLMRWLVWLMAAIWLGDWLLRQRSFRTELPPTSLMLPLVALGLVATLATLAADDPSLSLWGSHQRAYGLLTLGSYLLLALVVAARLRTLAQAYRLLGLMVGTTVFLLVLSGLDAAGLNPLKLTTDARSPIYATLGRANFVGAYLAMLLPITLALAFTTTSRVGRMGLLLLAVAQLAIIGLTLARAAWLAAGVGLLLLVGGWAWLHISQRGRQWLAGSIGLLLVAALLLTAHSMAQATAGSVAARRTIWQATLTLIGERPVLGHGLDSLAHNFMRIFPPELVFYQGRHVFVDRAHNWLLDTAVTMGGLGLIATLWLWGMALWWGWRALQRMHAQGDRERALLLLACASSLGANLAGNLFSFDVAATATASWLLLAVIIGLGREPEAALGTAVPSRAVRWRQGLAGLLVAVALVGGWWANGRFLVADIAQQRSVEAFAQGNLVPAAAAAQQAVALWPQEPVYWQQLAHVYGARNQPDAADRAWQEAVTLRPTDPAIWAAMGDFYTSAALQGQADTLPQANYAFAQAAELAPNHARLFFAWGQMYLVAQEWEGATNCFEKAVDLDTTDWLAWRVLADLYAAQGKPAQAWAAQEEAEYWLAKSRE